MCSLGDPQHHPSLKEDQLGNIRVPEGNIFISFCFPPSPHPRLDITPEETEKDG